MMQLPRQEIIWWQSFLEELKLVDVECYKVQRGVDGQTKAQVVEPVTHLFVHRPCDQHGHQADVVHRVGHLDKKSLDVKFDELVSLGNWL